MNAYFLSHNGLGDNLYMIGAVLYLLNYYNYIYFICKDIYYENVRLFYKNHKRVIVIPIDSTDEYNSCKNILNDVITEDILICGLFKNLFKSKITIHWEKTNTSKQYTIDYDTITSTNYKFIENLYNDINLDLNVLFSYFQLPVTIESKYFYKKLLNYKNIIFIHSKASNKKLNIDNVLNKNRSTPDTIIICANENVYNAKDQYKKFNLCNEFIDIPLIYYLDIIKNSNEIYIIDSCFVGVILPLLKTNKLKANIVRMIERNQNIEL